MQPIIIGRLVPKTVNPNQKKTNRWIQGDINLSLESRGILREINQRKLQFTFTTSASLPTTEVIMLGNLEEYLIPGTQILWKTLAIDHIIRPDSALLAAMGTNFGEAKRLIRSQDKAFLEKIGSLELYAKKQITDLLGTKNQFADKLLEIFKDQAYDRLVENPWDMINMIPYFTIDHADKVALAVGLSKDDPRRFYAIFSQLLAKEFSSQANTFMNEGAFLAFYWTHFSDDMSLEDYRALAETGESPIIKSDLGYHPLRLYLAEKATYRFMQQALDTEGVDVDDLKDLYTQHADMSEIVQDALSFELTDEQEGALNSALVNPLHIVTGGPGTGKTTVLEAVINKMQALEEVSASDPLSPFLLVAPTGKAAARMQEQSKAPASTIHSAFGILPEYGIPDIDRVVGKLSHVRYVIIDEASMLDSALFGDMCRVFEKMKHHPKILLVGDVDQLPPVQSGQVFHDILSFAKDKYPVIVTELTVVKRQEGGSNIPELAKFIREGSFPDDAWFEGKTDILKVVTDLPHFQSVLYNGILKPKQAELDTFQNLTPYRNGDHDDTIHAINRLVAPLYNPPVDNQPTVAGGNPVREYRLGDRVVNRRNLTQKVVNGSIGKIVDINTSPQDMFDWEIEVAFDDDVNQTYIYENWNDLESAYAITIHASQGSEYETVVLSMLRGGNRDFLTRNLLYTAITRASKRIVLIGGAHTFKTVAATPQTPRQTALGHWLSNFSTTS